MNDLSIEMLGEPFIDNYIEMPSKLKFISEKVRIPLKPLLPNIDEEVKGTGQVRSFEKAGPREKIYFDGSQISCAIVTCGGLCPGMNAVIRALVNQLWYRYKVRNIYGVPFGYMGFSVDKAQNFRQLDPLMLTNIHGQGGSILGSSRGTPGAKVIVDRLRKENINILFTVGGDGTMRGAKAIYDEAKSRGYELSVIGVPKTIDNDISYVRRSFGFETAVSMACQAINAAHTEVLSYERSVGIVKVMGRASGYIAANTALATGHANFCLVPENPFTLDGETGLLKLLEKRLDRRNHALIVVAEGAGQNFFNSDSQETDASGNPKLHNIGEHLKREISHHFKIKGAPVTIKYIDPSYIVRAAPANPADRLICGHFAQNAVHAAMSGKTGMLIGYWHGTMTHIPFTAVEKTRQSINPDGELWFNVLETTGQPMRIGFPK